MDERKIRNIKLTLGTIVLAAASANNLTNIVLDAILDRKPAQQTSQTYMPFPSQQMIQLYIPQQYQQRQYQTSLYQSQDTPSFPVELCIIKGLQ